jgi:eukaryotic-like serine/threonine-protein kinase
VTADLADRLQKALEGTYSLERELGAGGMATVYLARDQKHDRAVAVKVIHPDLAAALGPERFLREIAITAQLSHPHILPLFDSGRADGLLYYVMPFVAGESLRGRLERERQLPVEDAVRIAEGVAAALEYAHRRGVVHRDIKPENILLADDSVLVADFGVALAVTNSAGRRMTETGLSLGTPQYMSPEQAMGERTIDGRSDIYSLSCVLYEMLAGEPPFTGPTTQSVVAKVLTEAPPRVTALRPATPAPVAAAIERGLQKIPADRMASAADFAAALRAPTPPGPPSSPEAAGADDSAPAARVRRWQTIAVSSALVAVVAIGLATAFWLRRPAGAGDANLQLARQLTFEGTISQVAISDDGAWLAYTTNDCNADHSACMSALEIREVDGTQSVRILSWPQLGLHVRWSPDGSTVVFTGSPDSTAPGVYVTSRLGGSVRRITSGDDALTFTGDGRALAVAEPRGGGQMLVRYDAHTFARMDSTTLPREFRIMDLASSPRDGRMAAVEEARVKFPTVLLLSADGRVLDSAALRYDAYEGAREVIRWDPSGSAVMCSVVRPGVADDLMRLPVRGGRFGSHRGEVALGQVPTGYQGAFDVARTGRVAVVVVPTIHNLALRSLDAGHTAWTPLLSRTGYLEWPTISPDGARIAETATDNLGDNIYVIPVSGGAPRALTAARGTREDLHWSPDGHHISYYDDVRGRIGIVSVTDGVEHVSAVQAEYNSWLGSNALVVARTGTAFVVLDTLEHPVDSMRVADSVGVSSFIEANPATGQVAYWSDVAGGLVSVDGHSGRTVAIARSARPLVAIGWDRDGSLYATGPRTPLGGSQRSIFRVSRDGHVTGLGIAAPVTCQRTISVGAGGHLVACAGAESRPDVWLADAPGKSGW